MNWQRAKTLFIIVFFLANLCLVYIYVDKVNKSHVDESDNDNAVNFEQENIKLPKDMPNVDGVKMRLITADSHNFESEAKDDDKANTSNDGFTLTQKMDKAVNVNEDPISILKPYIDANIYAGTGYQYHETKDGKIIYEQTYDGYPIMNNNRARLSFDVDGKKATSYIQSTMEDIRPSKGENNQPRHVLSAREAIETLYYNQYLKSGQSVDSIRLGYYTVVKETNVQVLQANWEITVNKNGKPHTYYVEAVSSNPQITE